MMRLDHVCGGDCGIYYWSDRQESATRRIAGSSWVAILEPLGVVIGSDPVLDRKAEAVRVTQVAGVCNNTNCNKLLESGVLFPSYNPDFLIPLCDADSLVCDRAVLKFRVTESGLVFSPLQEPKRYFT